MPDDRIKISALPSALSLDNTDVLAIVQGMTGDNKETKKVAVTLIAAHLLEVMQNNNLDTSDKTIIGAINEVAETLEGLYPVADASGPIANFETELARPLEALKVGIVATQESGTPTPSSPKAISGWSEVNITKCRKNLLPNKMRQRSATSVNIGIDDSDDSIFLKAGVYTLNVAANIVISNAYLSGDNTSQRSLGSNFPITFTINNEDNFNFWVSASDITPSNITNFQLEVGSTASSYEAYNVNNLIIPLGETYYGGYVTQDKAGHRQFEVTHSIAKFGDLNFSYSNNSGNWNSYLFYVLLSDKLNGKPIKCSAYEPVTEPLASLSNQKITAPTWSGNNYIYIRDDNYTDIASFKTANANTTVLYELATPIIVDLPDGVPIETVIGVNNIFADSGDILECKYKDTIQHYIDTQIAATQALIL